MAHMIRTNDNVLTVGQKPWHGLGINLPTPPATALEAIQLTGIDYDVVKKPLFLDDARPVEIVGSGNRRDGFWGCTIRQDTGEMLGVVGPGYHVLQNRQLAGIFEPLVASGKLSIETCGTLSGGRKVWMLAKLNVDSQIIRSVAGEPDKVAAYWMIAHGHDGSMAARIGFTGTRIVCWNTMSAAIGSDASKLVKCLHTQSLEANLTTLMNAMDASDELFHLSCDQYRKLAGKGVSFADLKEYARIVVDAPADVAEWTKDQDKKIWEIVEAATNGIGNMGASWWDAYNGVTEVLTWKSSRTVNRRMDSLWFGDNAVNNTKALETALTMAG